MAHDDVGLPVADEARHLAGLEGRHQLPVMDVEHVGLDAEDLRALVDLRLAALRERPAGLAKCPTSPLVIDTNFTLWPAAAHIAASPPP